MKLGERMPGALFEVDQKLQELSATRSIKRYVAEAIDGTGDEALEDEYWSISLAIDFIEDQIEEDICN